MDEKKDKKFRSERGKNELMNSNEDRYHKIFNNACDMISINLIGDKGNSCNFIDINEEGMERLGYSYEEFLDMTPTDIVSADKRLEMHDYDLNLYENGHVQYEIIHQAKDGKKIPVEVNKHIFELEGMNVGMAVSRDITERKAAEVQLKKSLQEKEMLLKEIHHRVKNNFMIISSLLNLQSGYIDDERSQELLLESQTRVRSMALIHERLYQSTDLKTLDFGSYIRSLSTELFHTYKAEKSNITLNFNVQNSVLDINIAIPLGLIINELITNSLKHAFQDHKKGEINVCFNPLEEYYEFIVKDNGIGFPEGIDIHTTNSLGLQIINILTAQINGQIELKICNGTEIKIKFKK